MRTSTSRDRERAPGGLAGRHRVGPGRDGGADRAPVPVPAGAAGPWRDPDLIAAGQWWRLVTALFVQYDAVWQIVVVFACIAALGVVAERIFGHGWWLVIYLGCGVIGQAFGCLWEPPDAGASVAAAGLLGAVSAWIWGVFWPLVGIALTVKQDHHGPPLLVGFAVGALLLWRDRRRQVSDMVAAAGSR